MQIEVLPVPTEPEIRTVFPRGMPPFRMWSIASMPVTHRSRSSSECSVAGIDSVVTTRRAIFEVTALSIRSESRCCRTSPRIQTVAPFRRLLSSVDDFERVVPAAGAHPDEHPEGDRRLEPPRGLDPPEVEGPGPAELLHDADDRLLGRGVIPQIIKSGAPPANLGSTIWVFGTVLKALTTRARGRALWIRSPRESVIPTNGTRFGSSARGFVTSITTFPSKREWPAVLRTSSTAAPRVARTTTSPCLAASSKVPVVAFPFTARSHFARP